MGILVHTTPLPSQPLADALRRADPATPVWTEQDRFDPTAVEAMLAWRLKPGIVTQYPNLRVLCSIGAGVEKLLRATDLPIDLPVTRVIDAGQAQAIASYVLACTLPFVRDLATYREQQRQGRWKRHPVRAAQQSRVGILGQGHVAQAVAAAFTVLGYPVAVWGRSRRSWPQWRSFAGPQELPQLLQQADILVCTLPLTPETEGLLDRKQLENLPTGAYLVNVGRGGVLVEEDLRDLLEGGYLGGAALDVFEREPLPANHWIWGEPRVLVTPHIAGEPSPEVIASACLEALRCARSGRPQPAAVDRERGY